MQGYEVVVDRGRTGWQASLNLIGRGWKKADVRLCCLCIGLAVGMARRMRRSRRLATATLHLLLLSAMSCGSPGGGSEPPGGTDATTDLIDVDASLAPNAETLDSSPNPDDGANAPEDGADADADTGEVQDTAVGDSEDSDASSDVSDTPDVPVSDVADGDVPSTDAQSWEQK